MVSNWTEKEEFSIRTEIKKADDVLVLQLFGELDLATCETLESELVKAEESLARRIVLDLSALQFVTQRGSSCSSMPRSARKLMEGEWPSCAQRTPSGAFLTSPRLTRFSPSRISRQDSRPTRQPAASARLVSRVEHPFDQSSAPRFRSRCLRAPSAFAVHPHGGTEDGHRNSEVVQRRQGLRIHHAG